MALGSRPKRLIIVAIVVGMIGLIPGATAGRDRETEREEVQVRAAGFDDPPAAAREEREAKSERIRLVLASGALLGVLGVLGIMLVQSRRRVADLRGALASLERATAAVDEKRRELAMLDQSLESRVEARSRALSGSREQFRVLLETSPAIPWEMAPGSHRFVYVGPQATQMLGRSISEWTEEGFFERTLHPDDVADARAWLDSLSVEGANGEVELRFLAAGGRLVWFRAFATTALDEQRRPIRRGIVLDVTRRHLLEAELRSAQRLESVGRLAAGVAHEINTPVQFVSDSVHFVTESFSGLAALVRAYRILLDAEPDARAVFEQAARAADEAADTDYVLENIPQALESSVEGLDRIAAIVRSLKEFSHP